MAQVAFDTLKFVRKLEQAGVSAKQAEAFSEAVRESHESVDVATKRDLEDVRKEIEARFEKTDAQITEVRKDLSAEIAEVRKDLSAEIADVRKDLSFQITDVRKDLQLEMAGIRSEQKLMRWMLGAIIAGLASLVVKAFFIPVL